MDKKFTKSVKTVDDLRAYQQWFYKAMSSSMDMDTLAIQSKGVLFDSMQEDAEEVMVANDRLTALERLEVYNQQYWFQMLTVMQEEYPCLRHLLGIREFNELMMEYLAQYPSSTFTLHKLSQYLVAYLEEYYHKKNREMVIQCAQYEWAQIIAFEEGRKLGVSEKRLSVAEQELLPETPMKLQPCISVLYLDYDFTNYRLICKPDKDDKKSPTLVEKFNITVVHRLDDNIVYEKKVSRLEYLLLKEFQKGCSLVQALSSLEGHILPNEVKTLEENIGQWFNDWTLMDWLYFVK